MLGISRAIKRRAEKRKKKEAKEKMEGISEAIQSMPKACACGADFLPESDSRQLDEWTICVYHDRIDLRCPSCQSDASV
jgi:hypothetical protein|tara:strand:+ start:326 stop:562 length:237 start_codon:yes stop_codon:yes gene_type:complete